MQGILLQRRLQGVNSYRSLARSLILSDLRMRHAGTYLGVIWLILEPMMLVLTLTAVFTLIERQPFAGASEAFPLFFYAGVLPWGFFRNALAAGVSAFVEDANLYCKVPFPKEIVVIRRLGVYLVELGLASVACIFLLFYYQIAPTIHWIWIPVLLGIQIILCAGVMFGLGSLNVVIRDTATLCRALAAIGFWVTPVIFHFPTEGPTRFLYFVNPMVGIIQGFRRVILEGSSPLPIDILSSLSLSLIVFAVGYLIFLRYEPRFADAI